MKKVYLIVVVLCMVSTCYSQTDNFYFYRGKKINISVNKELIQVESRNDINIDNLLTERNISAEVIKNGKSKNKYWKLIKISSVKKDEQYELIKSQLRKNKNILKISSVIGAKIPISVSGAFYVELKNLEDYHFLEEIAKETSCEILRQLKYMPKWYALSAPDNSEPLNMANVFYQTGYFEEVDPGFDLNFSETCITDDDFAQQWGLLNSNGIDINACGAWDVTRGCANITVAVIDQGIDMEHDEFANNILATSWDAFTNTSPADVYGDHASHVAGIIGANQNDNQVSGVAPLASLMSVSHPLTINNELSEQLAIGMSWAWQNGADVINNSWGDQGGAFYNELQSALLESAIDDALSSGRNGLGSVVVFAAGNNSPVMDYPGSYTSDIICVGSIDQTGVRASSSAYGNELDLVAPGVNILSTIRNNGTDTFSGTSMAAPHVSGVAALVLSVNPSLTQDEVRDIIESTCTKVGGYNYSTTTNKLNGTWDDEVGYGLVDANAAVEAALPTITGSNVICSSGSTYSISNLPPGTSVTWTSSSNISFPSGNTGGTVTAKAYSSTSNGTGWIEATISGACGDVTLPRKDVWVGEPSFTLSGTTILDIGMPGIAIVNYSNGDHFSQGIQNSDWSFTGPLDYVNGDAMKAHFRASRREGGVGFIYATQTNQCGSRENRLFFEVEEPFFMFVSPNPANEYTELNFYSENELSDYQKEIMVSVSSNIETKDLGEYEIQIWNERKGLVKQMKSKSKKLQIPTNNLQEGTYFLHVIVNGEVHKQQLKIQR